MCGRLLVTLGVSGNKLNLKVRHVGVPCPYMNCQAADVASVSWLKVPSSATLISLLSSYSPLIKLKRGIRSVWGCSVGSKAQGRNCRNVKNPWLPPTLIRKMPHQSHTISIWQWLFSPPCCFNQFTYDIRVNKMETSFQYCQINIDLYSFFSATYYLPTETN